MKQGNLSEHHLEAAVFKNINRFSPELQMGSGVGNDYSEIAGVVSSQGTGNEPYVAWYKGLNNYMCSGSKPFGVSVTMLFPVNVKESFIKRQMLAFSELSLKYGIQITGGDSKIIPGLEKAVYITVFVGGKSYYSPNKKGIPQNADIVIAGSVGALGINLIIEEKRSQLSQRFDGMYLENALNRQDAFSVSDAVDKIITYSRGNSKNIYYMHDISFGGVYSALWQLGKWSDRGFVVDNKKIPIRQETIEVCEFFDINPYYIDSTGCLLFICDNGFDFVANLKNSGITAAVIGYVTNQKERLVRLGENDIRTLSPVSGDDLYKI